MLARIIFFVPGFLYFLAVYAGVKYFVGDLNSVAIDLGGNWAISYVEMLFLFLFYIIFYELELVSETGVNNAAEVGGMQLATVVFIILFVVGVTGVTSWTTSLFGNTQFLLFTMISAGNTWRGFTINSRTAMRSVGVMPSHS